MTQEQERRKALKTLRHILLYLNGRAGHEEVRTKYIAVRGPFSRSARSVGHKDAACCDRYRRAAEQKGQGQ